MRILVVSNLYPPHHIGGYELGCRDVVERLRARGHSVRVLTSSFRHDNRPVNETDVERALLFSLDFECSRPDPKTECRILEHTARAFSPEVVYFWNLAGLCPWLPISARWLGWRTVFFLSDTNFAWWRVAAWLHRWARPQTDSSFSHSGRKVQVEEAKTATKNEPLNLRAVDRTQGAAPHLASCHIHLRAEKGTSPIGRGEGENINGSSNAQATPRDVPSFTAKIVRALFGDSFLVRGWPVIANQACHFCSDFIRQTAVQHGIPFAPRHSVVVHWGVEPGQFEVSPRDRWPIKRLLYVGQIIPQKGIHTAITAFAQVAKERGFENLTFSLAGGGMHPEYEAKLRAMPEPLGVARRVHFFGQVPRAELPRIYGEHDVLVFPSEWDEPFAITPLEAIHCGLAVVGTTTGGSGELFRNRETAMTFRAGDAADCARAIRELCADRELLETITRNARRVVQEQHTLEKMVDVVEAGLQQLCETT
jgi:glycosyltransferase involved in cell wall biosynthesis